MRKFLFSFVAVLAFAGLFGLQGAQSSCGLGGGSFNCSGGTFWGTVAEINCWLQQLDDGICGSAECGTEWIFLTIPDEFESRVTVDCFPT
jgi:hypothetical protein